MLKRKIGQTNMTITPIGLGAMGMDHAYGGRKDRGSMIQLLNQALDMGYQLFDTAPVYGGTNEALLGEAFKNRREEVKIVTKFGITGQEMVEGHPKNILNSQPNSLDAQLQDSLTKLQTDYIDIYLQHRIDPNVTPEEVAKKMKQFMEEGKIRAWGISWGTEDAPIDYLERVHKICPISVVETQYSMVYRKPERTIFEFCEKYGVSLLAYSPLGNGFLSGTLGSNESFSENDFRRSMGRFSREVMENNQDMLDEIQKIANQKNATPAQITLAWEVYQKPFIIPIPGTTKLHRLKENMQSIDIDLTQNDISNINQMLNSLKIDETHF